MTEVFPVNSYIVDVDTSGQDIGRNEDVAFTVTECLHGGVALHAFDAAMQYGTRVTGLPGTTENGNNNINEKRRKRMRAVAEHIDQQ